jgi:hypothetical protein
MSSLAPFSITSRLAVQSSSSPYPTSCHPCLVTVAEYSLLSIPWSASRHPLPSFQLFALGSSPCSIMQKTHLQTQPSRSDSLGTCVNVIIVDWFSIVVLANGADKCQSAYNEFVKSCRSLNYFSLRMCLVKIDK